MHHIHCPAGTCTHTETHDPAHADTAADAIATHLMDIHQVPGKEVGYLVTMTRRTVLT